MPDLVDADADADAGQCTCPTKRSAPARLFHLFYCQPDAALPHLPPSSVSSWASFVQLLGITVVVAERVLCSCSVVLTLTPLSHTVHFSLLEERRAALSELHASFVIHTYTT